MGILKLAIVEEIAKSNSLDVNWLLPIWLFQLASEPVFLFYSIPDSEMAKLFQKKDDAIKRSVRRELRLTTEEDLEIRNAASIRQLDVSDFIRRAALGRKADVQMEVEAILVLIDVVHEIRQLHAAVLATGALPPEEQWQPVIDAAVAAMLRVEK